MATTESSAFRATTTTPSEDPPRYRVKFRADGRDHNGHVAFLERTDAEDYCAVLLENPDVTSARVVCSDCEGADNPFGICDVCTSYPLMPARPWQVNLGYRELETCEHCEACGDPFDLERGEGIHTANDAPLCRPCC